MKKHLKFIGISACLLTSANAAVTLTSLGGASGTSFVSGPDAIVLADEAIAVQITTNAQQWSLQSIEISWGEPFIGLGTSAVEVELYTSGAPFPTGSLPVSQALVGETNPSNSLETYTPSNTITLNPSDTFWIVLHVPSGDGDYSVNTSAPTSATGPWSVIDQRIKIAGSWAPGSSIPALRINATAVPEPSAALLAGISLLGLVQRKRTQRSQIYNQPLYEKLSSSSYTQ